MKLIRFALYGLLVSATALRAAELLLPQGRAAYHSSETIELAVLGLAANSTASLTITPDAGSSPVEIKVAASATVVLPPYALAPGKYTLKLDAKDAGKLTIGRGVWNSTMLLGNQGNGIENAKEWNSNFIVGNAFGFGQVNQDGTPGLVSSARPFASAGTYDKLVEYNIPMMIYMYWTGYITHQPWGAGKNWTDPAVIEACRLISFHTAQRLRRFHSSILYVGTIDEPGLPWGRSPNGNYVSGLPVWVDAPWYEARGWKFTEDPGSRPDADWMKYMEIRCAILKESMQWARQDLKTVWPDMVFSTDLYAIWAIGDGTDPLNQEANDIPATHVFIDWGQGKLSIPGMMYLEKAHDPVSKIAHAMNGRLFGDPVPIPQQTSTHHLQMNAMLAAGLHCNWWLGTSGLGAKEIHAVNDPAIRIGPLFVEVAPSDHDVAVLWGWTEMCLRQKDIAAREVKKAATEKILKRIIHLPKNSVVQDGVSEVELNMGSVGLNYRDQVISAHQGVIRAGYPAHIVHERNLPKGALKNYKTLVISSQTFEFPPEVKRAIAEFQAAGGKVVVDKTTTVKIDGAIVADADFTDPLYRWAALGNLKFTKKEKTFFESNYFMDSQVRDAVPGYVAAMKQTQSKPVFTTDSIHLAAERHVGGEGELLMVMNGHDKLPDISDDTAHHIYNYAPLTATYTLPNIPKGSVVYCIEGIDWKKVRQLDNPAAPQQASFEAGEMKLYLVAPRAPKGITASARIANGALEVSAQLQNVKMPWPMTVTVAGPDGAELYRVWRSINGKGEYSETFPVGLNAKPGGYTVKLESPVAGLTAEAKAESKPATVTPSTIADATRVFDGDTIKAFLSKNPALVIAYGAAEHKPVADKLAADLGKRGIKAKVEDEKKVFRRAHYPRFWHPTVMVYSPNGKETKPTNMVVKVELELKRDAQGRTIAITTKGEDISHDWHDPNTLVTVGGDGFCDWKNRQSETIFEPGCKFYLDAQENKHMINCEGREVKVTPELRAKWEREWGSLDVYHGGYQLPPELPEAYRADSHLILLGDGKSSELVRALQASELLLQVVDAKYPGPGKSLVSFAWSPFAVEKNVILIGATDVAGLEAGARRLLELKP